MSRLHVRSVAKVLRPDRGAGKSWPAPTIGGVNNFRGHKKPSSGASGDDSQRLYLHKNKAVRGTWLERGALGAWGDPFLPKTRNACEIEALSRLF